MEKEHGWPSDEGRRRLKRLKTDELEAERPGLITLSQNDFFASKGKRDS